MSAEVTKIAEGVSLKTQHHRQVIVTVDVESVDDRRVVLRVGGHARTLMRGDQLIVTVDLERD